MSGNDTSDENGEQSGQNGSDGQGGRGGQNSQGDRNGRGDETGTVEKAVMAFSIAIAVLLFAYAGFQALGGASSAPPEATVVGTERLSDDSVAVRVQIRNPRDTGLVAATVESDCTSPPPEVRFSYLPADSTETGTLVCPANTTSPNVSVANWIEA